MPTVYDSKSLHAHCTFTFLTVTLTYPRLLYKQSLQSVFGTVKRLKTQSRRLCLHYGRNCQSNSQQDTANAPSYSGPHSLSSRQPRHTTTHSSQPGGDAIRQTQHAQAVSPEHLCRSQRTRHHPHDIRPHTACTPPFRYRTVDVVFVMQFISTTLPSPKTG